VLAVAIAVAIAVAAGLPGAPASGDGGGASGVVDIALTQSYAAWYLVGNQTVPRGDPNTPTTETSYVTIQGAVVRITDSQGKQIRTYTTLTSATIAPSSGALPSYAPVLVTTLDPATLTDLALVNAVSLGGIKRLVTYVRFFGKTLGGLSIESNEFSFPVDVCAACLIRITQQDINPDPRLPQPNCFGNASGSSQNLPIPCFPGQDTSLDCSQCLGNPACLGPAAFPGLVLDAGGG